jgi:hypothetical protein
MTILNNPLLAGVVSPDKSDITNPALGPGLKNLFDFPDPAAFFNFFIPKLVTLALIVGILVFFFMFLSGAIQWIASGGDKQALESAKSRITNALIGIVLLFAAYAIIKFIGGFFGIDLLILDIGALKI